MNVFNLRDQMIAHYSDYIQSFINVRDEHIRGHVETELNNGLLWPQPLLQLNPSFMPGESVDSLVENGTLHPLCKPIFRLKEQGQPERPMRLHRHQSDAIQTAATGDNYVLTTGTGSGKSLAYIIPIVNYVLNQGSGQGIRAVIVYPMNALANSQQLELEKFLKRGFETPPVTFRRYTGQESEEERQAIQTNPPDILLTNYVMLELLLTRPGERKLVSALQDRLQFLVLDELHTYRGRQGADVALLVRRARDICANPGLQCMGTSATMAGGGTFAQQQEQIAQVASRLFGSEVKPQRVIGETLRRITGEVDFQQSPHRENLRARVQNRADTPPQDFESFLNDPLAAWIESTFGLAAEAGSGRLTRAVPISIAGKTGAAARLAQMLDLAEDLCRHAIERTLMAGYDVLHPETRFPVFAFRLHQFISRGDTVYASLEAPAKRYITTQGQQYVPGDRKRVLLPITFCRECGQEYYTVFRHEDRKTGEVTYLPRQLTDQTNDDAEESGFLYPNADGNWSAEEDEIIHRLPEDWLEYARDSLQVKRSHRRRLPAGKHVLPSGVEGTGHPTHFYIQRPFPFCLTCGVAYSGRQRSDYGKLASLSSEGRSTATTVLGLTTLQALRSDETLHPQARKLLSFTDNRQDASLQAGHFNDFIEVGMLRAALYSAVSQAGPTGITHEHMAQRVFDALKLPLDLYAVDPEVRFQAKHETERALREILAYRIYQDLRRGWRVTSPNLEQCGLLHIDYASLDELCEAQDIWHDTHPALADATPETRREIGKNLLDYLRRELAIRVDYLDPVGQESLRQLSSQRLRAPWALDENERLATSFVAYPKSLGNRENGGSVAVSGRGGFGLYLRRVNTFPTYRQRLSVEESEKIIVQLFERLRRAGLVEIVEEDKSDDKRHGYMVPASALIWKAGDGTEPLRDIIRVPSPPTSGSNTNTYFTDFYRQAAARLHGLRAHEHTAQVPSDIRIQREEAFRHAELPLLFCSPTMELGVDISQLNAVNMRNVPPTPANYAQRSGRAGRSGQPALVFTYCTTGSPHDQHFFKQPDKMVAGSVVPPRIDLANEDLLRAHVHAVWLAETGLGLGSSLMDILDLEGESPALTLLPSVQAAIRAHSARAGAKRRLSVIFDTMHEELSRAGWYRDDWLDRALDQVEDRFDLACNRWRDLYRAALSQREVQNKIIGDATRPHRDKDQARRLRAEAEAQLELLTSSGNVMQSDFYSYRYFASEGFLPGYNFPRLPLSAYVPGRRRTRSETDEYLNRPRFLAISEFGPRSIIYHEGSRYIVNRVILPVDIQSERGVRTGTAKLCPNCGHLHPIHEGQYDPDRCEQCNTLLKPPVHSLMRMQNVATKRRDRINSDEEERVRMGYDLATAVHFDRSNHQRYTRVATVQDAQGNDILRLTYGHAATLWRINWGWRRRRPDQPPGFVLDTERGYWASNTQTIEDDPDDPMSGARQRVVPYVEDRRNCLLIEPIQELSTEQMASLQPALKNAIQVLYHLEDNELAVEPLPDPGERRFMLFYEATEGGAGVLRQLVEDNAAMARIAREALQICHFDPDSGADLRRPPGARDECEAACYDCLMSYSNQMDHRLLDRMLIYDLLRELSTGTTQTSPVTVARATHLEQLKALCDSEFERTWLDFLNGRNLRLPDVAQQLIQQCNTRPDFLYREQGVAIYIDGIHHNYADIAAQDTRITACLEDAGFTVIRFGQQSTWEELVRSNAWLFGSLTDTP